MTTKEEVVPQEGESAEVIGNQIAGAAARYDKPNISARMMLLDGNFWTDVVKAIRGEMPQPPEPPVEETPDPPVLTGVDPDTLALDDPISEVFFNGSGFSETTTVVWNGEQVTTNFISTSQVSTNVEPATAVGIGAIPVGVETNGVSSETLDFTFTAAEEA